MSNGKELNVGATHSNGNAMIGIAANLDETTQTAKERPGPDLLSKGTALSSVGSVWSRQELLRYSGAMFRLDQQRQDSEQNRRNRTARAVNSYEMRGISTEPTCKGVVTLRKEQHRKEENYWTNELNGR